MVMLPLPRPVASGALKTPAVIAGEFKLDPSVFTSSFPPVATPPEMVTAPTVLCGVMEELLMKSVCARNANVPLGGPANAAEFCPSATPDPVNGVDPPVGVELVSIR